MKKTCFKTTCTKPPVFTCECKSGVYFCKKHMGDHLLIQRNHNIVSLYVILDDSEEQMIKKKASQVLKVYSEVLKKAEDFCKILIESMLENSKKLLNQIRDVTSAATRIGGCIFRGVPIDAEDLKTLEKIELSKDFSIDLDTSSIINLIKEEFENRSEIIFCRGFYDEMIFFNKISQNARNCHPSPVGLSVRQNILDHKYNSSFLSFGGFAQPAPALYSNTDLQSDALTCINTKTLILESKPFKWENSCSYIRSSIKIKNNIYFSVSTSDNSFNNYQNNTNSLYFLKIDFSKQKIKTLYTMNNQSGGGIVLHKNSIFMFSGTPCTYQFDLEMKKLTTLAGLPQKCSFTSVFVNKDIFYVTGYGLQYIYTFNHKNNKYRNAINFNCGTYRYLFENWLVSMNDSFYEIKNDCLINHGRFEESSQFLMNYSGCKRGNFIFFMTQTSNLYRIDISRKSISLVRFT